MKISPFFIALFLLIVITTQSATLNLVSDTLSTSELNVFADHNIRFTTISTIPVSGKIVITPQSGFFSIPAGLDFTDIDLLIDNTQKSLALSPGSGSGSVIGASVITGASGSLSLTLNDADSISGGSSIVVRIGTNAEFGATGDQQIQNPSAAGSYKITISTKASSEALIDQDNAMTAIVAAVVVSAQKSAPSPPAPTSVPAPTPAGPSGGGPIVPAVSPLSYTSLSRTVTVMPSTGGLIVHRNPDDSFLLIEVPPGFWLRPVTFFINTISPRTLTLLTAPPKGLSFIDNHIYSILATDNEGVSLQVFFKPLLMRVRYTPFQAKLINSASMRVFLLMPDNNLWQAVPGSEADLGRNEVVANLNRLGLFAVLGSPTRLTAFSATDFNLDGRVDLVDFSILLFNWGKPINNLRTDINGDKVVDLVDFSILLFWWTG